MSVNTKHTVETLADFRHYFDNAVREVAAVGVAETQDVCARVLGCFQCA